MIADNNLQNEDILKKYIASLYFAITTITTVGYGDISARTKTERMMSIIFMIIAGAIFSFSIGNVGDIVIQAYKGDNEHKDRLLKLDNYMKIKKIPQNICDRARKYLIYNYLYANQDTKEENDMI
jgi:voltage-gated potassium channel Kch